MVFTNHYTEVLANKFLNFKNSKSLREDMKFMCPNGEPLSAHVIFSALVSYLLDELILVNESISKEEEDLYNYLEDVRQAYSGYDENTPEHEFDGALCTSFLEGMLNCASHNIVVYERFIPYLGDKCKEYCKAWDQFTGVRSPGLWGDLEWHRALKGPKSMIEEHNKLDK